MCDAIISSIQKEIRVVGIKRSGNHAIINWILRQCPGPSIHFNDVKPEHPFDPTKTTAKKIKTEYCTVVYSLEDRLLQTVSSKNVYPQRLNSIAVRERLDLLILRDPYNSLASRYKRSKVSATKSIYAIGLSIPELWVSYAREYLGESSFLGRHKIVVNYNRWCQSKSYRKELASTIGLDFTDDGYNEVPHYGQGSSFDKELLNHRANKMNTLDRWQVYQHDPEYIKLFGDRELVSKANRIFQFNKNLNEFIQSRLLHNYSVKTELLRTTRIMLLSPLLSRIRTSPTLQNTLHPLVRRIRIRLFAMDERV